LRLVTTIEEVLDDPQDENRWMRLAMFPRCILATPRRGGKGWRRPDELVVGRLGRWKEDAAGLWTQASNSVQERQGTRPGSEPFKPMRAIHKVREGMVASAAKQLSSDASFSLSDETLEELKRKHPHGPPVAKRQGEREPVSFSEDLVMRQLRSFPLATAAGPDQLRAAHLLTMVKRYEPLLGSLTKLCNILAAGECPLAVSPFLAGATLIALTKKDGGIRPIAVGSVLRRLVSKCAMAVVGTEASEFLRPNQVGVGVSGGGEAVPHLLRGLFSLPEERRPFLLLKIDFRNAFNEVSRERFLEQVSLHFPGLYDWAWWCYGRPSRLVFGEREVFSSSGVQQGDPLGPFFFCLALKLLVDRLKEELPDLEVNVWFLDDGCLVGSPRDLRLALELIGDYGKDLGLHLNLGKCELCGPGAEQARAGEGFDEEIIVRPESFDILGAPIGPPEFCGEHVAKRLAKVRPMMEKLLSLGDLQAALILLRHCLGFGRAVFAMRTCPPELIAPQLRDFDELVKQTFGDLLCRPLTRENWLQATLSLRNGGMGLRSTHRHAEAAYIGSVNATWELVVSLCKHPELLAERPLAHTWAALIAKASFVLPEDASLEEASQDNLSAWLDRLDFEVLHKNAPARDKARLLAVTQPWADAWLRTLPYSRETTVPNPEMTALVWLWLGVAAYAQDRCDCGMLMDRWGLHALVCRRGNTRGRRHNAVVNTLRDLCRVAGFRPVMEKSFPGALGKFRPADIHLTTTDTYVDVTVFTPTADDMVSKAAVTPLVTALKAEEVKRRKYTTLIAAGMRFVPFAVETFGGYGPCATSLLARCFRAIRISYLREEDAREIKNHYLAALSVARMREVAKGILTRVPDSSDMYNDVSDLFYGKAPTWS
jgi:hypothetical protein